MFINLSSLTEMVSTMYLPSFQVHFPLLTKVCISHYVRFILSQIVFSRTREIIPSLGSVKTSN